MIKKFIQLYWYEDKTNTDNPNTFGKNRARLRKHGLRGMKSRLDKDYIRMQNDFVTKSILDTRYTTIKTRIIFVILLLTTLFYTLVIKSELYESQTKLIVKDMQSNTPADSLGLSLLGMGASSQLQDSKIVESYLKSLDIYKNLDNIFHLTQHYKSTDLDLLSRLSNNAKEEEILQFYNKHLYVLYDETSGILTIRFTHTDKHTAQRVLTFLVKKVEEKINTFNRKKAKKELKFVRLNFEKAKQKMNASSAKLEAYQNTHLLLDPKAEASSSNTMIAELESSLLQKKIKYSTMSSYLKENTYELKTLKKEIEGITQAINKEKEKLTGTTGNTLNKELIEYESIKLQLGFDTEVYKNALIQLESTKLDVLKEAKTLSILSKPNLPDGYTYPDKPKMFITILIVAFLLYGIIAMLGAIIKNHRE